MNSEYTAKCLFALLVALVSHLVEPDTLTINDASILAHNNCDGEFAIYE
ncbi:hypothetical protein ACFLW6_02790 [Chloroflexota bacterium]